jgi:hypothetical protein
MCTPTPSRGSFRASTNNSSCGRPHRHELLSGRRMDSDCAVKVSLLRSSLHSNSNALHHAFPVSPQTILLPQSLTSHAAKQWDLKPPERFVITIHLYQTEKSPHNWYIHTSIMCKYCPAYVKKNKGQLGSVQIGKNARQECT